MKQMLMGFMILVSASLAAACGGGLLVVEGGAGGGGGGGGGGAGGASTDAGTPDTAIQDAAQDTALDSDAAPCVVTEDPHACGCCFAGETRECPPGVVLPDAAVLTLPVCTDGGE